MEKKLSKRQIKMETGFLGYDEEGYPIVSCFNDGHQLVFYCEYCKKIHYHGNCGDPAGKTGEGHRVAHCFKDDSPYRSKGYVLKIKN